jgi:invasion protein IalB
MVSPALTTMARSIALATAAALTAGVALAQQAPAPAATAPAPAAKAAPKPAAARKPAHPKPQAATAEKAAEKPADKQDEAAAPDIPAPAVAEGQVAWTKICNKDDKTNQEICATQQELRAESNQPLAFARIQEMTGQPKKFLIIAVPSGVYLPAGLKVQVDKNKQVNGQYMTCQGPLCIARVDADATLLAQMKKGEKLVVTALSPQNKAFSVPFTLAQFKDVYEGKGLDAKQLEAEQAKLQDELKKRADEARKKLLEQQTIPVSQPAK